MPAISSRFNTFLLILLIQFAVPASADKTLPEPAEATLARLGERIYGNECGHRPDCLTSWNAGEDFPSLGIGHFIWYQANQDAPFEETFPHLLAFLQDQGVGLPDWLAAAEQAESPWASREHFYAEFSGPQMLQLRQLLAATQPLQTRFIVARFYASIDGLVAAAPEARREAVREHIHALANASSPYGLYALVDYIHFKGSGLNPNERYQGEGWGLLQVLLAIPDEDPDLASFVRAAEQQLRRRVSNAPVERNVQRWLNGWLARLQTYLPESGSLEVTTQ